MIGAAVGGDDQIGLKSGGEGLDENMHPLVGTAPLVVSPITQRTVSPADPGRSPSLTACTTAWRCMRAVCSERSRRAQSGVVETEEEATEPSAIAAVG